MLSFSGLLCHTKLLCMSWMRFQGRAIFLVSPKISQMNALWIFIYMGISIDFHRNILKLGIDVNFSIEFQIVKKGKPIRRRVYFLLIHLSTSNFKCQFIFFSVQKKEVCIHFHETFHIFNWISRKQVMNKTVTLMKNFYNGK